MFEFLEEPEKQVRLQAKYQRMLLAAKALFFVSLGIASLVLVFKL